MKREWMPEEVEQLRALDDAGCTERQIAAALDRTESSVKHKLKRLPEAAESAAKKPEPDTNVSISVEKLEWAAENLRKAYVEIDKLTAQNTELQNQCHTMIRICSDLLKEVKRPESETNRFLEKTYDLDVKISNLDAAGRKYNSRIDRLETWAKKSPLWRLFHKFRPLDEQKGDRV